MTCLKASNTRIPPDTFNRVVYKGERVRIERRGGVAVYIVPEEDLRRLEEMEDREDVAAAKKALAEPGPNIPWKKVKARLGL